jgi:plastocyanin
MAEAQPTTPTQAQPGMKARWTTFAALGLILTAMGPLLLMLATLIWGENKEEALALLIIAAIPLTAAFLVYRFGTWSKIVGIVVGVLAGGAFSFTILGLAYPASFFDFVPAISVIPGALMGIIGSIAALVAGRRGHLTASPEGGEQRGIRIALMVLTIVAVASAALTAFTRSSVDESNADATVKMRDTKFDQEAYAVDGGAQVFVDNEDPAQHTFTVDELDVNVSISPLSEDLVKLPDKPGNYRLYCTLHSDMETKLTIK